MYKIITRVFAMNTLKNKVAFVTGSSRGCGACIAKLFAEAGAAVAIHGRDRVALSAVEADIQHLGGPSLSVVGDVTSFAALETMRLQIERALGPIDIAVANAGGSFTMPAPIEELSEDGWRASVEGNLTATFLTIKSVLPGMKARKAGNIITISSAAGRRPHPHSPIPYSVAKAGIQLLTQDVAAQAGPFGIRVNGIAPETILTDRNAREIPPAIQETLIDAHPVRRLGTPEDVANAALFLATSHSSWISG